MMQHAGRWFIAVGVTIGAFAIGLWISGAIILPIWLHSESDRWVIAAGLGVALAALAALWGVDFAQAKKAKEGKNPYIPRSPDIHMEAKASGSSRINQSGGNQNINDR